MNKETITINGKRHPGIIVSNFRTNPMELWFVFDEHSMKEKFGERIRFTFEDGKLIPSDKILAAENKDLFRQLESAIRTFIFKF